MSWYDLLKKVAERQGMVFEERPLQRNVVNDIQRHFEDKVNASIPILLRLPCGYGKTQIGESLFLNEIFYRKWFTRGMVYVLPTRSLTIEQTERIRKDVECVCRLKSRPMLSVSDFHGESDTYYFYADAAISTFDIFIYAYARKSRTGHHLEFPAGTISTSYIVFDEAHMIQDDYLYSHTVMNRVLRVLSKAGVPTIIMTATMPKPIERAVFDGIDYEECPRFDLFERRQLPPLGSYRGRVDHVQVHEEDILDYVRRSLSLEAVKNKRILIVCNTVGKAQSIYREIVGKPFISRRPGGIVILLHSRYVREDRRRRSQLAIKLMKKSKCEGCGERIKEFPIYITKDRNRTYCGGCATPETEDINFVIVVATQVVEAGLDISSNWLLTDTAPLDALVQRSGRCSRFTDEKNGRIDVFYYDGVHSPYRRELVEKAYQILNRNDDHCARSLTDFVYSTHIINENYEVFRRKVPEDFRAARALRLYLSYLEGTGFLTFSVDWGLLRQISARSNAFITLVAFPGKIPVYELEEERADLHRRGRYRFYLSSEPRNTSYRELLSLVGVKTIGIRENLVRSYSFTLSYPYALRGDQPKSFLKHTFNDEVFMIELRPVVVDNLKALKRECYYLLKKADPRTPDESNYLVNPQFYDEVGGLRVE
jgi:CRISPR-associated helicase Cas3